MCNRLHSVVVLKYAKKIVKSLYIRRKIYAICLCQKLKVKLCFKFFLKMTPKEPIEGWKISKKKNFLRILAYWIYCYKHNVEIHMQKKCFLSTIGFFSQMVRKIVVDTWYYNVGKFADFLQQFWLRTVQKCGRRLIMIILLFETSSILKTRIATIALYIIIYKKLISF